MSEATLPVIVELPKIKRPPKKKVILRYRVLEDREVPGFIFCNETGSVTVNNRTFGRFEEIDNYNVRNCFILRRPMTFVQEFTLYIDDKWQDFNLDHRTACGWRCLGREPILEAENIATGEKHLFIYTYHSQGFWLWCHVTPTTEEVRGVFTYYQLPRLKMLLMIAGMTAGYYVGATAAATFALWRLWTL